MSQMELMEAWAALGEDPEEIISEIRCLPDLKDKKEASRKALKRAEKLARVLMGIHHPDKNHGDPKSSKRFNRVKMAIESIRFHTDEYLRLEESVQSKNDVKIILG